MKFKSDFIKIFQKLVVKYDKSLKIFKNGIDNNYAELVEDAIDNSVTAARCAQLMADYIAGKGFGKENNEIIVNEEKGITLLQFTQDLAESLTRHRGVFIHCNYDGNFDIKNMDVLPFIDCRICKKDDNNYNGKISVCSDWSDPKLVKQARVVDVYNDNKRVIQSQIEQAGSLAKYNGQIFYFKFGKYIYPLAPIHPAIKDAESESEVSTYKNVSLKKGFFGKTIVITKPLVDSLLESDSIEYREQETERDNFKSTIKQFMGAHNVDGVIHIEMDFEGDDLEKEFIIKQVDSNIDDKLFAHTETSVSDNIRMCFNNVPAALIRSKEGALFGSSGEAIEQMKIFYQDQTNKERMTVEQIVNKLMSRNSNKRNNLTLTPLINVNQQGGNIEL